MCVWTAARTVGVRWGRWRLVPSAPRLRVESFTLAEIAIMFVALLPWLIGIAIVILAVTYRRRTARANERIAEALERERRTD